MKADLANQNKEESRTGTRTVDLLPFLVPGASNILAQGDRNTGKIAPYPARFCVNTQTSIRFNVIDVTK